MHAETLSTMGEHLNAEVLRPYASVCLQCVLKLLVEPSTGEHAPDGAPATGDAACMQTASTVAHTPRKLASDDVEIKKYAYHQLTSFILSHSAIYAARSIGFMRISMI